MFKETEKIVIGLITAMITWVYVGRRKESSTALSEMQLQYKDFVLDVKAEINDLRKKNDTLQKSFNDMFLSYSQEKERSENWEKLHRELKEKYFELEKTAFADKHEADKRYESLKRDHDKLKIDFDKLKKSIK